MSPQDNIIYKDDNFIVYYAAKKVVLLDNELSCFHDINNTWSKNVIYGYIQEYDKKGKKIPYNKQIIVPETNIILQTFPDGNIGTWTFKGDHYEFNLNSTV